MYSDFLKKPTFKSTKINFDIDIKYHKVLINEIFYVYENKNYISF
jgi:hypothetical protein